jgi:hypothetical protein
MKSSPEKRKLALSSDLEEGSYEWLLEQQRQLTVTGDYNDLCARLGGIFVYSVSFHAKVFHTGMLELVWILDWHSEASSA